MDEWYVDVCKHDLEQIITEGLSTGCTMFRPEQEYLYN